MKLLVILVACLALLPAPAEAAWAIALVKGGNPIISGNQHSHEDEGASAVAMCNQTFKTHSCRVIAKGDNSCVALANNGAPGSKIRWAAGQGNTLPRADLIAGQACDALHTGACKVVHHFCQ